MQNFQKLVSALEGCKFGKFVHGFFHFLLHRLLGLSPLLPPLPGAGKTRAGLDGYWWAGYQKSPAMLKDDVMS